MAKRREKRETQIGGIGARCGWPPTTRCHLCLRTLWRHRGSLLEMAAEHILHMQKALSQMNLQLHHVLSDIS